MNITNFAKKLAEKPVFKTRIKSDQVKLPEIAIGYFLAPFCAMFANAIFGAYLNRYYVDVLGWTKFGAFATLLPIVSVIFVVLGNLMICLNTRHLLVLRSGGTLIWVAAVERFLIIQRLRKC